MSIVEMQLVISYLKKLSPIGWAEQERLAELINRLENRLICSGFAA